MPDPRKPLLTALICVAAAAIGAATAAATTAPSTTTTAPSTTPTTPPPASQPTPVIAPGVSVAGVDLSNLTVDAAAAKLQAALTPQLQRAVIVGLGARVFRLQPKRVGLALDARRTAQRAYHAGLTATPGASSPPVALAINYSHQALTAFVATIARRVDVAPRSARFHIALVHQRLRRQRDGHFVNQRSLRARLAATLLDPAAPHQLQQRLLTSRARVTVNTLRRRYATLITIDRAHFKLRLFKRLHWVKTYEIAVGMAGLATPTGIYHVQEKQVNPSWHVPNSSWAGSLAGQTIPPGPNDPIKARWLGLGGGVGIHGTAESFSIGSRASHGCIRMLVPDVIALYRRVPLGTPVYIR